RSGPGRRRGRRRLGHGRRGRRRGEYPPTGRLMAQSGDDEGGDDGGGRQTERPEARVAEPDPVSPAGRLVFDLIPRVGRLGDLRNMVRDRLSEQIFDVHGVGSRRWASVASPRWTWVFTEP